MPDSKRSQTVSVPCTRAHILYERLYSPSSGTTMCTRLPSRCVSCARPARASVGQVRVTLLVDRQGALCRHTHQPAGRDGELDVRVYEVVGPALVCCGRAGHGCAVQRPEWTQTHQCGSARTATLLGKAGNSTSILVKPSLMACSTHKQ